MNRYILHRSALAISLALVTGVAGAQTVGTARAKAVSDAATESAHGEAAAAQEVAQAAREAASQAAVASQAHAVPPQGEASADYHAHVAHRASVQAQQSAQLAAEAANRTGAARSVAHGGTAQPVDALVESQVQRQRAQTASLRAQQAAAEAVVSSRAAVEAVNAPPAPPPQPRTPTAAQLEPDVTVISHVADPAMVAASRAFDRLDVDGDGAVSPAEAVAEPALTSGFKAVDSSRDGRIDRDEYTARLR